MRERKEESWGARFAVRFLTLVAGMDSEIFQIVFWSSVVLSVALIAGIFVIATMNYQTDTLLFSDTFKKS